MEKQALTECTAISFTVLHTVNCWNFLLTILFSDLALATWPLSLTTNTVLPLYVLPLYCALYSGYWVNRLIFAKKSQQEEEEEEEEHQQD